VLAASLKLLIFEYAPPPPPAPEPTPFVAIEPLPPSPMASQVLIVGFQSIGNVVVVPDVKNILVIACAYSGMLNFPLL
jgi:hypothetical protein